MVMNVSLDTADINAIKISTLDFIIWQHFSRNWTPLHLQKLATIPEVPVAQVYRGMTNSEPIHSFAIKDNEDPSLIWTILKYPGTYIGIVSMIFVLCIGVYCLKFWIWPASPRPYSPVSSWHVRVVDEVEVAPIYRYGDKAKKPIRPHRNHELCIEQEAKRPESSCKQPALEKGVPTSRSFAPRAKIPGTQKLKWLVVRHRFWPVHDNYFLKYKNWFSEKQ